MFETYRILGEQRQADLLREAQRLHAGQAASVGTPARRFVSVFRSAAVELAIRLRGSTTRAVEPPRSQLHP